MDPVEGPHPADQALEVERLDDVGRALERVRRYKAPLSATLGRHMNIKDVPETYAGFERLMDSYEAEHFAYDEGARRVADSTLALMRTFYARPLRRPAGIFAKAVMDQPLREAFRYDAPPAVVQRASRAGLRARGLVLRAFPARRNPKRIEDISWIRSYPDGYRIEELGTFPVPGVAGCPVRHEERPETTAVGT